MAFRYGTNEAGEKVVFRSAKNDAGEVRWFPTDMPRLPDEPDPMASAEGMSPRSKALAPRKKKFDAMEAYNRHLSNLSELENKRDVEAQNMSWLERANLKAGQETDKLLTGTANLFDFAKDAVGLGDNYQGYLERVSEQEEKDRVFDQVKERLGTAEAGGMLPYILSGIGAGPLAYKGASATIRGVAKGAETAGRTGRSKLGEAVESLANKEGAAGWLGGRMKGEWSDPLAHRMSVKAKQVTEADPYREGLGQRLLGDTLLGGAEGALHFDNDFKSGAIASLAGRATGEALRPMVRNKPSFYSKEDQDIIKWAEDQGMQFLPGEKTGANSQRIFEQGLRGDRVWTDAVNRFDRNKEIVSNRIAYKAMGVPEGQIDRMTPEKMQSHMQNLRDEFEFLESNTVARFEPNQMKSLKAHMDKLSGSKTKAGQAAYKAAKQQMDEFQRLYRVKRKRGRFVKATFDGSKYQDVRSALKDNISTAIRKGDASVANALKPMLRQLDDAMENGIRSHGGKVTAGQWKDLNERYAMTKLFIEHGSTPTGNFDVDRLGSYFREHDQEAMLLERGGARVNDLQRLVKLNHILKKNSKHNLSGDRMYYSNPKRLGPFKSLLQTPAGGMLPIVPSMYLKAYTKGYPSVTGLLNMGEGGVAGKFWDDPGLYTRALSQGTQLHPEVAQVGADALNYTSDKAETAIQWILDKLK